MPNMPDFLSHYYEAARGPFQNLSDLSLEKAEEVMHGIRQDGVVFASKRAVGYMLVRRELEDRVRQLFLERGGAPRRLRPHYMILGDCPWLETWYIEPRVVRIPLVQFDERIVSFTYGDTFPAMRYGDGKPYRGRVYLMTELAELVARYGLPQEWNADGKKGPDRYIEAQVWDDAPLANAF